MSNARELAELGGSYGTGGFVGMKNRIINPAMVIDQRNAGASVTSNSATNPYTLDRWRSLALAGSGQFKIERSPTAPSGFINSLLFTSLAATSVGASDAFGFRQTVEGLNCYDLNFGTASASPVTLSFWARSSLTGTFGGAIANNSADRSYPFAYTISSANTWEYKTITVAGDTTGTWPTDTSASLVVWFGMGVGSTRSGTAGAWAGADYRSATGATSVVGTNGATYFITGVQLEKGSTATSFDYRPYSAELALCQRYYQLGFFGSGKFDSSTVVQIYGRFSVPMRAAPSASAVSGSVDEIGTAARSITAVHSIGVNSFGGRIGFSTSGATSGAIAASTDFTVVSLSAEL